MRKISRLGYIAILGVFCFGVARAYYNLTDDFRKGNYMHEVPYHSEWEHASLSTAEQTKLDKILDQKFAYLGKGAQSFAFMSEDGRYILKLFKFKHLKPSWLVEWLPPIGILSDIRENERVKKLEKLESVFSGYHLAYKRHKKESGLLYVHLNRELDPGKIVQVRDKLGLSHFLNLNEILYVVQEKAVTTRQEMIALLSKGSVLTAIDRVNQIFDLYLQEYAKGIYDRDHGVMHNTGFVYGETVYPIHLDIGKLSSEEKIKNPEVYRSDLLKIVDKFDVWFKKNYPQYYPELMKAMENRLSTIFGEQLALHS
ncbi:hypothetical protein [Parachlamydia sp. AcF125]|uniref:hypothetical protein n=1 Tax=Parachlamydia sp. AcF125 TaxID=2795736 RepID=UPI001BCA205D|nr:hypothetical protein [Parachlamydia sp. AcF125]MBS4167407.1 hypothetical protein [Parachlamydia sp. AcF125]